MGEDVETGQAFTRAQRQAYRIKVKRCLDVLARMLAQSAFDGDHRSIGLEIELNLTDADGEPAMRNAQVLEAIADADFQTELGRFNIEINVPPRLLSADVLTALEADVRRDLNAAQAKAADVDAFLVMVGILPTLHEHHLQPEHLSENARYVLLNEQIFAARGEDMPIDIAGPRERLQLVASTILPEAACTSVQLHQQIDPAAFADYWNAAQAIAGVQAATGSNSPLLFGRELWSETRIALFEQATDTRSEELKAQGVRPRVWFGERWITSIFDLFEENVRYFPALLPLVDETSDPEAELAAGTAPSLAELTLHNGTIYRWNRPVYDTVGGRPHLRIENRLLPAGPTVADILANAAFYYGLVRILAEEERPVWSALPFRVAAANFHAGARDGIRAQTVWPGVGEVAVTDLVVRHLLPIAQRGLEAWGLRGADIDRFLGIIERRCVLGRTGATWQTDALAQLSDRGVPRDEALRELTRAYRAQMHENLPVHEWVLP